MVDVHENISKKKLHICNNNSIHLFSQKQAYNQRALIITKIVQAFFEESMITIYSDRVLHKMIFMYVLRVFVKIIEKAIFKHI